MRSAFNYSQGVYGTCGHVCDAWPQVRRRGGAGEGTIVICDTCTRQAYNIDDEEVLAVWVRIPDEPEETSPLAPKKKTPRKKKLRCSLCSKDHLYSDCPLIAVELPYGT